MTSTDKDFDDLIYTPSTPKQPPVESLDSIRDFWRGKLSGEVLDELFEEAKTCGHEGACWDLVNMLADILEPHTQTLIQTSNREAVRLGQVKCAAEMSILDQEITSLKAQLTNQEKGSHADQQ